MNMIMTCSILMKPPVLVQNGVSISTAGILLLTILVKLNAESITMVLDAFASQTGEAACQKVC